MIEDKFIKQAQFFTTSDVRGVPPPVDSGLLLGGAIYAFNCCIMILVYELFPSLTRRDS